MNFVSKLVLSTILLLNLALAKVDVGTILNDYMNTDEPDFKWNDTGHSFPTLTGGTAHMIEVTSLKWLNDTIYTAAGGHVWTH